MRKTAILDIIFYIAIPYIIWNYAREPLGDYYAILFSTIPGIFYTVYRFFKEKQFNISGLFILGSLCISTSVNLLSNDAESMLWNQVYVGYFFASIFLVSIFIKQPIALYFAVDFAALQGHARANSKALFSTKGIFIWFQLITFLFVLRGIVQNTLKAWLINTQGVDGYGQMIIYLNISGWIFSGIIFLGFILVGNKINRSLKVNDFNPPLTS
ncbi:VC0807 family protein [Sutcliffiella cohnii]|uniref:VC0807 family protein n=1 Tax=Sutcliffiella cohnii TaxID=33932 RepID=UPI002E1B3C65|nr:hypothetical protein [Sutcliffiella cohnii]